MKKSLLAAVVFCSSAILATVSYSQWDVPLAFYFKDLSISWRAVAQIVTKMGDSLWSYLILVPGWLLFHFIRKNNLWSMRLFYLFVSLSASGLLNLLFKWLTGRHRPIHLFELGLYRFDFFGVGYELTSFPSGHAATAFSLAAGMTILFPRWGGMLFIPALMIAATRVMLTAHFMSDVVGGACVGILSALFVKYLFDHNKVELNTNKG